MTQRGTGIPDGEAHIAAPRIPATSASAAEVLRPVPAGSGTARPSRPSLAGMILERPDIGPEDFQQATGWEIKPEGACKGEVCVPLPDGAFDLVATADRLGMGLVSEPSLGLRAVGPAALGGRALATVDASDFCLPDLDGDEFRISSLRGRKVLIVAWAPY